MDRLVCAAVLVLAAAAALRPKSRDGRTQRLPPPTLHRLGLAAEFTAVAAQAALAAARARHAETVFWVWALFVCAARGGRWHPWRHLVALYTFSLVFGGPLSIFLFLVICSFGTPQAYFPPDGSAPSPEPGSSVFAFVSYAWMWPLVLKASRGPLSQADLMGLRAGDYALNILGAFSETGTLGWALARHFKGFFFLQAAVAITNVVTTYAPTLIVKRILEYASGSDLPKGEALRYVLLLPLANTLGAVTVGLLIVLLQRLALRVKTVIIGKVYGKALRRRFASGSVVNLVAIDAFNIAQVLGDLPDLVEDLVSFFVAVGLLYMLLGWSALAGALLVVLVWPLYYQLSEWMGRAQEEALAATDTRLLRIAEALASIRIIKSFVWEPQFIRRIMEARKAEVAQLKRSVFLWSAQFFLWFMVPTVVSVISFCCYAAAGHRLTVPVAFTAVSLFTLLRRPLDGVSELTADIVRSRVSLKRVQAFLDEEETERDAQLGPADIVGFKNATLAWDGFTLCDLNIEFQPGLNVVVGATGAGKSSLLLALLGEMTLKSGQVCFSGRSTAYCAQTAWLLNDTIRENILFGTPFVQERYDAVVTACALTRDFAILPAGDLTEIGERGVTLSGGQKQRVSLARAVYSKATFVLLDDCLLAVDAHTAQWIYTHCITGLLMAGRTCVLVSHNVALATKSAKWVVVMKDGRVDAQGSPSDLKDVLPENLSVKVAENDHTEEAGKLVEEEEKSEGHVDASVYLSYFATVGGAATWTLIVLFFVFTSAVLVLQSWWVSVWAESNLNPVYHLSVYAAIGLVYAVLETVKIYALGWFGLKALSSLFGRALHAVFGTRPRYFDKTPVGRLTNRFSKDLETLDQELMNDAEGVLSYVVLCLSIFALIGFATPQFLPIALGVIVVYYFVGGWFVCLVRELNKLDAVTKLPIHSLFSETLSGVATIRAYAAEQRFVEMLVQHVDQNNKSSFYVRLGNTWFSFYVSLFGSLVMFSAAYFVIDARGLIKPGVAGLSLSYAVLFNNTAMWMVRLYARCEMNMNLVERFYELANLAQEPQGGDCPSGWPEKGEIRANDVSLRYAEHLPQVIKNVSFYVKPGSKVAIVGRTGAGKLTIVTAFFRFMELDTGQITIDGVDIATLRLDVLRRGITIIPQDPTLFAGTIRSNLDPFGEYRDEDIATALGRCNLLAFSPASEVNEGGTNFSQGQRQLMCLARSLLKNPKIIVLDEATASIDYELDAKIQRTIREEFTELTVVTIAHRLKTIVDYDSVIVMEAGEIVEHDSPATLIGNEASLFHAMCADSGELDVLKEVAKGGV